MGRSFKYHRPRGVLAAGAEEPNALVTVRRDAARYTPNLRATQVELYEGLEALQPEPLADARLRCRRRQRLLRALHPGRFLLQDLHVAAARLVRRSTSRASAPPPASGARRTLPDPDRYATRFAHCDVLVVGAGPAGLAAARAAAAAAGARVILCDEQPRARRLAAR